MATPLAAAEAAIIESMNPTLTGAQVVQYMMQTAQALDLGSSSSGASASTLSAHASTFHTEVIASLTKNLYQIQQSSHPII